MHLLLWITCETKDETVPKKLATYQLENKEVAIICNHQHAVSKGHDTSMSRLDEKIDALKVPPPSVDGAPYLVASGSSGIICVINTGSEKIQKSFIGHGDSINEIRTESLKPSPVISASKDESVRLWNVHTGICILIFVGAGGHQNEVLSVDFHPFDIYRIASFGMDNSVNIWAMKEFWTYVEKSFTWTNHPSKFHTKYVQFPVFITSIHTNTLTIIYGLVILYCQRVLIMRLFYGNQKLRNKILEQELLIYFKNTLCQTVIYGLSSLLVISTIMQWL